MGVKSDSFRVTTVNPLVSAVAAIQASRSGRGSGPCSRAARRAHRDVDREDPAIKDLEEVCLEPQLQGG